MKVKGVVCILSLIFGIGFLVMQAAFGETLFKDDFENEDIGQSRLGWPSTRRCLGAKGSILPQMDELCL